jgi:hypothetical protein
MNAVFTLRVFDSVYAQENPLFPSWLSESAILGLVAPPGCEPRAACISDGTASTAHCGLGALASAASGLCQFPNTS